MRVNFNEVFSVQDGMISPLVTISIGGVLMTPGVSFGGGASFGGLDISTIMGKDLDVTQDPETRVVTLNGYFD